MSSFTYSEQRFSTLVRYHKKISSRGLIFIYNPESKEDIHLAHIEKNIFSFKPITDHRDAIVFQPMAQASPACTKTNRRPDDQFRGGRNFFFTQFVPNGCLHWIPGYR